MYDTLSHIPESQRICFPVAEELQLGVCIGLSLQGFIPVCIFPRFDFMLRAYDQLINHLDKLEEMTVGRFKPKVIIRTRVGGRKPLDAGPQHKQDHTIALSDMLTNVTLVRVVTPDWILPTYREAMQRDTSTVIVERLQT